MPNGFLGLDSETTPPTNADLEPRGLRRSGSRTLADLLTNVGAYGQRRDALQSWEVFAHGALAAAVATGVFWQIARLFSW